MSKTEFVQYLKSLELKELGFDEHCFGYFTWLTKELMVGYAYEDNKNSKLESIKESEVTILVSAPLWQQAFTFFRDKYGYDVSIKRITPTEYSFVIEKLSVDNNYYFIDFPFTSYEIAQSSCLNKLIEITKYKK